MSRIFPRSPTLAAALFFCVAVAPAPAVEQFNFTTNDGTKIEGATFSRRTPDGVAFITPEGVSKIRFERLPVALQKRFRYDPEEAKAFRARKAAAAEKQRLAMREAELRRRDERDRALLAPKLDLTLTGTVLQVLPDGVLLHRARATRPGIAHRERQVQIEGPTTLSPNRERRYRTVVDKVIEPVPIDIGSGTVKLVDKALAASALDGQTFSALVYPIGRFHYTDKLGSDRTIARFTTERDSASAYAEEKLAQAKAERAARGR